MRGLGIHQLQAGHRQLNVLSVDIRGSRHRGNSSIHWYDDNLAQYVELGLPAVKNA
ncbi:hypothetical protein D3C81_1343500 [compost metagenome]